MGIDPWLGAGASTLCNPSTVVQERDGKELGGMLLNVFVLKESLLAFAVSGRKEKKAAILRALDADPVDIVSLRQKAISWGGLLSHDLRRRAWPLLLEVDPENITPKPGEGLSLRLSLLLWGVFFLKCRMIDV